MTGKVLGRALVVFIVAVLMVSPARAQDATAVAGTYCLVGVQEVGSCLRLSAGGKFEYFLSYGAYDERSEGTWKLAKGEVIVDSLPYDRRPTFTFKRMQKSDTGRRSSHARNDGKRAPFWGAFRLSCGAGRGGP